MKTVGAADGHHQLANPQGVGVAELRRREPRGAGAEDGEIAGCVGAQYLGFGLLAVVGSDAAPRSRR